MSTESAGKYVTGVKGEDIIGVDQKLFCTSGISWALTLSTDLGTFVSSHFKYSLIRA
jgi:hypothetical protein